MKLSEAVSMISGLLDDLHLRLYNKYVTMIYVTMGMIKSYIAYC